VWYIKHIYYPEYLHIVLKLRLFLIYFFGLRQLERLGLFYSYFKMVKVYKILAVYIYLYHGVLEDLILTFFGESLFKLKKLVYESHEQRLVYMYNGILNIFVLFKLISYKLNKHLNR